MRLFPYDIENIKDEFENIPKVLVDYYLELGQNEKLNLTQDKLISPDELYICDKGYLYFTRKIREHVYGE